MAIKKENTNKSYQVQAVLHLMVTVEVNAKSIDEAIETSKTFKETDFVEILGEYLDGNFNVTGVYESCPAGL